MKIGIDASRIALEQRTGTENYTYKLIEALKKVDQTNKYILYFNKIPNYFEISQQNVSTRVIPMTRLWTQFRLAVECLVRMPDILFVPAHTIPFIRWPKLKTIVTVHDLGAEFLAAYHRFPQKLYLNWSTKYVASNANHIIAVSESTKKDLVKTFKVDPQRISVVPEAVDTNNFYCRGVREVAQVKKELGITKPYLLFVGTIQPRKNLEKLIEAFSQLQDKNLELILAGRPGWLYEDIYAAPKKFNVAGRVKFLGYVNEDQLPALYSGAEAFVFPSLYEGFGLPLLEAMATGTPVITSKTSCMPETTGGNAILVNPNKTREITQAMAKVLTDKLLRAELTAAGLRWAKQFTWEETAKKTIAGFEKVYKE